ncbi:enterotoxin [Endobacter medicaginis]
MQRHHPLALLLLAGLAAAPAHADESSVLAAGPAAAGLDAAAGHIGDAALRLSWTVQDGHLVRPVFTDLAHGRDVELLRLFSIDLPDGRRLDTEALRLTAPPKLSQIAPDPQAARAAERRHGLAVDAEFASPDNSFTVHWRVEQRDGSPYLREIVALTPHRAALAIRDIALLEARTQTGEVIGDTQGSPIRIDDSYFGVEDPLSSTLAFNGSTRMTLSQALPVQAEHTLSVSAVAGVVRDGQLRRDFQLYVEAERAHPYRPFLGYNSWYDIGYFTPYTQSDAESRIRAIGDALVRSRGVELNSFLFDDGWDDRSGLWRFSHDFPQGFKPLCHLAASYGAAPGVWLSPWGGYGKPKEIRVANGARQGLEVRDGGFDLSAPHYYDVFHHAVMGLLNDDCINQFKFDGTGNADHVAPGSVFNSDFDAAIYLIADIYADRPDTFINLTTGTYPSPFWLRTADSIWRGGEDDMLRGVGSKRQRWITYRDSDTYREIVVKAPLFPLNSLMLHGIIYAQKNQRLNTDPDGDFADEVHSFFATGTDEQELYITPDLLKPADWDVIAQSAKWARANADVLRDSHWVGGDPGRLEPYGWAAWTPAKAFLTLRNPDRAPRGILIDPGRVLELPRDAPQSYAVRALWSKSKPPAILQADHPVIIQLAPFEVMTLQLTPR